MLLVCSLSDTKQSDIMKPLMLKKKGPLFGGLIMDQAFKALLDQLPRMCLCACVCVNVCVCGVMCGFCRYCSVSGV